MPKRSTQRKSSGARGSRSKGRRSSSRPSTLDTYREALSKNLSGVASADYRRMLSSASGRPAVRYIAGGIAAYALTKLALRAYRAYPEIGIFFRDNLETVEEKLREFRGGFNEESAEARH